MLCKSGPEGAQGLLNRPGEGKGGCWGKWHSGTTKVCIGVRVRGAGGGEGTRTINRVQATRVSMT